MAWWWPFKKREAAQAELEFRESLSQALLRQDDLVAATERLKESRKSKKRAAEETSPPEVRPRRTRDA